MDFTSFFDYGWRRYFCHYIIVLTKVSKKFSFTFHRKIFLIFFHARSNISATYFRFGQFALKRELALLHHFRCWRHENCNCQNSCAWLCKICLATRFRYLVSVQIQQNWRFLKLATEIQNHSKFMQCANFWEWVKIWDDFLGIS